MINDANGIKSFLERLWDPGFENSEFNKIDHVSTRWVLLIFVNKNIFLPTSNPFFMPYKYLILFVFYSVF